MTSRNENLFTIVQGPDRLDIIMAFANWVPNKRFEPDSRSSVSFVTKDGKRDTRVHVMVSSLQHESGSGKSWNIEGYVAWMDPMPLNYEELSRRVAINYQINKKEGTLWLFPK